MDIGSLSEAELESRLDLLRNDLDRVVSNYPTTEDVLADLNRLQTEVFAVRSALRQRQEDAGARTFLVTQNGV
jgi:hypothetical protein